MNGPNNSGSRRSPASNSQQASLVNNNQASKAQAQAQAYLQRMQQQPTKTKHRAAYRDTIPDEFQPPAPAPALTPKNAPFSAIHSHILIPHKNSISNNTQTHGKVGDAKNFAPQQQQQQQQQHIQHQRLHNIGRAQHTSGLFHGPGAMLSSSASVPEEQSQLSHGNPKTSNAATASIESTAGRLGAAAAITATAATSAATTAASGKGLIRTPNRLTQPTTAAHGQIRGPSSMLQYKRPPHVPTAAAAAATTTTAAAAAAAAVAAPNLFNRHVVALPPGHPQFLVQANNNATRSTKVQSAIKLLRSLSVKPYANQVVQLNHDQILQSMPKDASSVFYILGRRINFDSFSHRTSLYSLLRAWMQDDPSRVNPNDLLNINDIDMAPPTKRKEGNSNNDNNNNYFNDKNSKEDFNESKKVVERDVLSIITTSKHQHLPSTRSLKRDLVKKCKVARRHEQKSWLMRSAAIKESLKKKGIVLT